MNINDFRDFVLFVAKKAQSGANPTPSQFNLAVERSFIGWVMKRYGNPADYLPNRPVPRVAWQQSQKISDDLSFLITRRIFAVSTEGTIPYPDGTTTLDINGNIAPEYLHASSFRYNYIKNNTQKEISVDTIKDNELGSTLGSSIVTPSKRFPKCSYYDDFIQFYPKDLQRITFTYLRIPKAPKWGFTLDENKRPVYDSGTSVDLESGVESINDIAMGTLALLGVSIKEPFLFQASEQFKQIGV